MKLLQKNPDLGLLVLRLSVGVLMLLHGISKLIHGLDGIKGMLAASNLPAFFAYGVLVGEVVAPLLIILGLRARVGAAILAFNCVVAVAMAHAAQIFALNAQGGWAIELLGLYLLGSVALLFTGAGKYAVSSKHLLD